MVLNAGVLDKMWPYLWCSDDWINEYKMYYIVRLSMTHTEHAHAHARMHEHSLFMNSMAAKAGASKAANETIFSHFE